LLASVGGHIQFTNIRFGAVTGGNHIRGEIGGLVEAIGNYSIVGGGSSHWNPGLCGVIRVTGRTITLSGTPNFTTAFCNASTGGQGVVGSNTFSGYSITLNGALNVFGASSTYLPGDVDGTTDTGGQYG
jgi:hypothetical protein